VKRAGLKLFETLKAARDRCRWWPRTWPDYAGSGAFGLELGCRGCGCCSFGFAARGAHICTCRTNLTPGTVAYTGTHDNDTTQGWWNSAGVTEHSAVEAYVGPVAGHPVWPLIRATEASVAELAIVPAQDLLGWARRRA